MQNFIILRNPFFRKSYGIKKEEELTNLVAYLSCFTGYTHFAWTQKITSRWGGGVRKSFVAKHFLYIYPHTKCHSPRKIHSHPKQEEGKRHRERERKSTLIVDTEFCMPRLGLEHALHSDQIYLILFMIFQFWYNFI